MEDDAGTAPLTRRQMRLAAQERAQARADVVPGEEGATAGTPEPDGLAASGVGAVDAPPQEEDVPDAVHADEDAPGTGPAREETPGARPGDDAHVVEPARADEDAAGVTGQEAAADTTAPEGTTDVTDQQDATDVTGQEVAARPVADGAVDVGLPAGGHPFSPVEDPEDDDVRWDGPFPPVDVVRPAAAAGLTPAWAPSRSGAGGPPPVRGPRPPVVPPGPDAPDRPPAADEAGRGRAAPAASAPAARAPAAGTSALSAPGGRTPPLDLAAPPAVPHAAPTGGRADGADLPTLDDLLARRSAPPDGPAQSGWRRAVRVMTGGLLRPGPGRAEQELRDAVAAVQRDFGGPRTVVVINPKGGAHKTTATLLIAATFGMHRGGYVLAWDNNETRGTMGWRTEHGRHQATAVDLLADLERFDDPRQARVGDLDAYVRTQTTQFDVLASDEDAASAASVDAYAFRSLHRTLSRFYRVMVVDTGNNMRASNWQAAVEAADQVVLVTTVREDTAQSAAWAADALRATGHEDAVRNAVTVLADPAVQRDPALAGRLHDHFSRLTRTVVDVPWDPALVSGGPLDVSALHRRTRESWLRVTAAVAEGL